MHRKPEPITAVAAVARALPWSLRLGVWLLLVGCLPPAGIRYPGLPTPEDGALQIVHFDVGQADASLVIYKGKSLLIDCGSPLGDPQRASQRIPRRLDALLGSRHLDYLLVTHYHQDHFGAPGGRPNQRLPSGIFSLIERGGVTVGTVLDRGAWTATGFQSASQKSYVEAVSAWLRIGVIGARRELHAGDRIDLGPGLDVEVVAAAGNGYIDRLASRYPTFVADNPPSENDYSVALKITLGDFEMFTGGDLSGFNVVRQFGPHASSYNDVESLIADRVGAVEVLRVNHHGSSNSSNPCFCEVTRPLVSVFSTGPNHYGHPDPGVYRRLAAFGRAFITGGADPLVWSAVEEDIVGDDVEVLVAPGGARFWVNGEPFTALSDQAEAARPGARTGCVARDIEPPAPETYPWRDGTDNND